MIYNPPPPLSLRLTVSSLFSNAHLSLDLLCFPPEETSARENWSAARWAEASVWRKAAGRQNDTWWLQHPKPQHTSLSLTPEGRTCFQSNHPNLCWSMHRYRGSGEFSQNALWACHIPESTRRLQHSRDSETQDKHLLSSMFQGMALARFATVWRSFIHPAEVNRGRPDTKLLSEYARSGGMPGLWNPLPSDYVVWCGVLFMRQEETRRWQCHCEAVGRMPNEKNLPVFLPLNSSMSKVWQANRAYRWM